MKRNMGTVDRIIRLALVAVVVVLYVAGVLSPLAAVILGIVAVVFLATSVVSFCPLYAALRISTRSRKAG